MTVLYAGFDRIPRVKNDRIPRVKNTSLQEDHRAVSQGQDFTAQREDVGVFAEGFVSDGK